jgi:hypothetical protein
MNKYRKNWHSQNGEDGILQELCRRLGVEHGFAVEFGAWDGMYASNTYHLVSENGWSALYIEGDPDKFELLKKNPMVLADRITPHQRMITRSGEDGLSAVLSQFEIDQDFDLLSIDIDSIDYYIWESLNSFRPKIVIIEVNSSTAPHIKRVSGNGYIERNFANMIELGRAKGYTSVGHTGNIVFVRDDLIPKLSLAKVDLKPESIFDDRFYNRYSDPTSTILRVAKRGLLKILRKTINPHQRLIGHNPYDIYWDDAIDELFGIKFDGAAADCSITLTTSRPELLAACLAVAVHPNDERYSEIVGTHVATPIFGQRVPVIATTRANPNYHTGAMMVSSFADPEDVDLVRDLGLSPICAITSDGTMSSAAGNFVGMTASEARQAVAMELGENRQLAFRKGLEATVHLSPSDEGLVVVGHPAT